MGRAHYPLLWRVLDRAANRLDHVCWADVTARGYGVLELTRSAATARWWFVHPYATDPAQRAIPAAAVTFTNTLSPLSARRFCNSAFGPIAVM